MIGANRITVNLNGHEVSTDCEPADCEGRVGIDNSGGFDRVRIRNGTVEGFEQNILLEGANRNTLAQLSVKGRGGGPHWRARRSSGRLDEVFRS